MPFSTRSLRPRPGQPKSKLFIEQTNRSLFVLQDITNPNYPHAMKLERVEALLQKFPEKRLLVIGDLMLDEFVWGRVSRISPEAPVPVVEVIRESYYPGGAANVARNVREFTLGVDIMGLVGEDSHADRLRRILTENGIALRGLQSSKSFQTIVKTRIIARHQQVVRVDRETPSPTPPEIANRSIAQVEEMIADLDGIILEDYGKGFLQQSFVDKIAEIVRAAGKVITADPNPRNKLFWHGLTAVKPNRSEAFAAADEPWREPEKYPIRDEPLLRVGQKLLSAWEPQHLLITLGEQGMMLFGRDILPYHVPPRAQEVYDLSGAGDTAIALFTLALVSGASPIEAAEISNHASGVVVAKLGTAIATPAELLESFRLNEKSPA
jgi:rfaE bifunctional protein kinase chain/domain